MGTTLMRVTLLRTRTRLTARIDGYFLIEKGQQNLLNKLFIKEAQLRAFLPFGASGLTGGTS